MDSSTSVIDTHTSKSLILGESRGLVLDKNLERLVAENYYYAYAAKPSITAITSLKGSVSIDCYINAVEQLSNGNPIVIGSDTPIECKDVLCEQIYKRYNVNQTAAHIIGYVNADNDGVYGVEKSYNELLKSHSGTICARFFTDGIGNVMDGSQIVRVDNNYNSNGGVVLTIDKSMQQSIESIIDCSAIECGAAVLVDAQTGAIRACVSRPGFDPANVQHYLNDSKSPLFNRALGSYPVGSVFKSLIAASALEQGVNPKISYNCTGSISNNSSVFRCTKAHGEVDMSTALAYSCNCYFVNLINKIEVIKVLETAENLGFGSCNEIAEELTSYSGNLPEYNELDSFASLANFSFGQGSLTATPLQIATLYCAIANDGMYEKPYLVEGFCDENGRFIDNHVVTSSYRAFSSKTAAKLRSYLELAVSKGTGKNAKVNVCAVAGKTATAQTGEYDDGKERLVTWFAGFFEYKDTEYVLVIMSENGVSGANDCAPVFSEFVNSLYFVDK